MPNKKQIDWSSLERRNLIDILWSVYDQVVGIELTINEFQKIIRGRIKNSLPLIITKKISSEIQPGLIYVGGFYHSDLDQEHKKCIEIMFVYHPWYPKFTIDKNRFLRLCHCFADTILHEIIHMRQYRRRNFKILPDYVSTAVMSDLREEQSYYGSTDEIDAHSFNIACELLDKFKKDVNSASDYVSKTHRKGRLKSKILQTYLKIFEYDQNHKVIKRLKKRIIRYLPKALDGKPYKNKDWINY